MTPYPRLFAPLRLGNLTLRNRVVFSAHLTNYAENGLPTEQHASYYEARARGGAGLIITEEHSTHPSDRPYEKMIAGYRPEAIEGYQRITDAVHAHGSSILAQINTMGARALEPIRDRRCWRRAPSPIRCSARCPKLSTTRTSPRFSQGSPLLPAIASPVASTGWNCRRRSRP